MKTANNIYRGFISAEKFKKLGYKEEPVAFNVSYEFLTDPDFARGYHFSFGEKNPLLEWVYTRK